jgi:peptidoglycan/LPS O-acetylase OafA/YrhL
VFRYGGVPVFHPFASRLACFGMSLFFVLSGFVIQYNYSESFIRARSSVVAYKFFAARFARLYPLYAITIFVSVQQIPIPNFVGHPWTGVAYLTLTQSWFNVEQAIFTPDWSVSTEWFFYFAFIPLTIVFARVRRPILTLAIFSVAVTIGLITIFYLFAEPLTAVGKKVWWTDGQVSAETWQWIIYYSPLTRLCDFIVGMLAAKVFVEVPAPSRPVPSAMIILLAAPLWCAAVLLLNPITDNPVLTDIKRNFIFSPALGALLVCLCRYETRLSRTLASRPFLFAGEISYSVYVWSFGVLTMLAAAFVSPAPSPLAFLSSSIKMLACVGVTTVFAYGSYLMIETPCRRWLRAFLMRPLSGFTVTAMKPRENP